MTLDARRLSRIQTAALVILASCAVLALLVYGKTFLVPLVIALLVTTLLSSAIVRLEAIGFPSWLAAVCAIGALLVVLVVVGIVLFDQASEISTVWPKYVTRFNAILADLTAWAGRDVSAGIAKLMTRIDLTGLVSTFAGSAGSFFAAILLIMLYSAFLLAERGQMPSKFGYLVPDPKNKADLQIVIDTVNRGIRQYLSVKTLMSLITGGLCYIILKVYAVDFAEFWGLLIFFLNFIPNIGSAIAVIIPSLLALVQFDTVLTPLTILVLMIGVQFVIGNIVEPKFMGRSLNLSSFVVIVSLTFWGIIWGIEGMFLSVPITASLVIICRTVPELRWIAILLSVDGRTDDPRESLARQDEASPGSVA